MRKKVAVYTAIFGGYDSLVVSNGDFKHLNNQIKVDYYCFTDNLKLHNDLYTTIYKKPVFKSNSLNNRYLKIILPEELNSYDVVIYHDGSLSIIPERVFEILKYLQDAEMACYKHPQRNCVYDEIKACVKLRKENRVKLLFYAVYLFLSNVKAHSGLYENGMLVRNVKKYNESNLGFAWWNQVKKKIGRDQLSLPLCIKKTKSKIDIVPGSGFFNEFTNFVGHKSRKRIKRSRIDNIFDNLIYKTVNILKSLRKNDF